MSYPMHEVLFSALMGYFLGSFPAGVVAGKIKGVDLRKEGSGNIGFTNAYRVLGKDFSGKLLSVMVLVWDMGKGLLATMLATSLFQAHEAVAYAALFSVLGHLYPVWLKFRGGKGVAVGFGAILGVCPPLGLSLIAIWVTIFALTRISSLSALVSYFLLPILAAALVRTHHLDPVNFPPMPMISVLIWWHHRENIRRLLSGNEKNLKKS
ncbi:MAG: glycerol-3-phosphate 1-O-acyltransferase PlsY [Leptospirillum sp.]